MGQGAQVELKGPRGCRDRLLVVAQPLVAQSHGWESRGPGGKSEEQPQGRAGLVQPCVSQGCACHVAEFMFPEAA